MKNKFLTGLFVAAAAAGSWLAGTSPAAAFTWNDSWTQPTILGKSQTGFDDSVFQPSVQQERVQLANAQQFILDPAKLNLKYDHNVSVYFINEGAGYRNQLAYQATGTTTGSGLVFNDVSSTQSILSNNDGPLKLGDGVNLGNMTAGTQLDFWLRADGYNRGDSANIFGTQIADNLDGLQHVVAYAYKNYLLLGFEDLYGSLYASGIDAKTGKWNEGSDRDFNDTVFVVDVGEKNIKNMMGEKVPEPSLTLALMGMGLAGTMKLRRRQKSVS